MTTTITLADLEALAGVTASKWERNGRTRYYLNIPGAAYALYWTEDGKVHVSLSKGTSTSDARAIAKTVLGCSLIDRHSRTTGPAAYVVVEG